MQIFIKSFIGLCEIYFRLRLIAFNSESLEHGFFIAQKSIGHKSCHHKTPYICLLKERRIFNSERGNIYAHKKSILFVMEIWGIVLPACILYSKINSKYMHFNE